MKLEVDPEYPGTAVARMRAARERVQTLSSADLSVEWELVRQRILWAAGLKDIKDAAPGRRQRHSRADCRCAHTPRPRPIQLAALSASANSKRASYSQHSKRKADTSQSGTRTSTCKVKTLCPWPLCSYSVARVRTKVRGMVREFLKDEQSHSISKLSALCKSTV